VFSNLVKSMLRSKVSKETSEFGSFKKTGDSVGRGGRGESGVVGLEYAEEVGSSGGEGRSRWRFDPGSLPSILGRMVLGVLILKAARPFVADLERELSMV